MDQQGLLANSAGALFCAPRDMRKRLTESWNRSFLQPVEMLVKMRHISTFMKALFLEEWGVVFLTSPKQYIWDWYQSTCTTML